MMITPEKIEEWLREVAERPASAGLIIDYITRRLRDLSERNQALQAENLALVSGKKVEDYEQRIAHLEYQLELLRRQFGAQAGTLPAVAEIPTEPPSILLYDEQGRVLRCPLPPASSAGLQLHGLEAAQNLRLLAGAAGEEALALFSSGRVQTLRLDDLPLEADGANWAKSLLAAEPRGGERLAGLAPLSRLALADSLVQASRRGFVKKLRAAMSQSILANSYIGSGIQQPPDQPFQVCLASSGEQLTLVSRLGYLVCLKETRLPAAIEEGMKLEANDYLTAAFMTAPGQDVVIFTQLGKLVHLDAGRIEVLETLRSRGQPLFSGQRRQQGVRVAGACPARAGAQAAGLHSTGRLAVYNLDDLIGAGSLAVDGELLAIELLPGQVK